ncbi:hypothetical protein NTD84_21895 [Pseudomonas sp. 14P_8.1_Bac3]|uniref:hypothetical protein n=1 Tax=Pseudomonas sp. 14P_8.1_Bac3 TaxID=2971621 RepID=UPI0021C6599F|nr:hypothetical protein [Pseudomonas sp. 14P_8.1_Bac3]MCU1762360.1 hypothetical protein [Pseudomonas sp. 14P_8.1_Bac3]
MMKLIRKQQTNSWKTVASLIFCSLFLPAGNAAIAEEASAGLCNGAWGIVGGYYCNINGGVGGGSVLCVFSGRDNDRNGAYRSGTSDQCVVNKGGRDSAIDCNEMCRLNNNCSRVSCPVSSPLNNAKL